MSYSPLSPPLTFTFATGGYTPPTSPLALAFTQGFLQEVYPPSIDSTLSVSVTLSVTNALREIIPTGFEAPSVCGDPTVWFRVRSVTPNSFTSAAFGDNLFQGLSARLVFTTSQLEPQQPPLQLNFLLPEPNRYIVPSGVGATSDFGNEFHSVTNQYRAINAVGIPSSGAFGTASIENAAQAVLPGGIAPLPQTGPNSGRRFPSPVVDYWTKIVAPAGVAPTSPQIVTTHYVAGFTQFIDLAGRGQQSSAFSTTTRVEDRIREVAPAFISSMIFGQHRIAITQELNPSSWENVNEFGLPQLDINLQRVLPISGTADPASYGQPAFRNAFEFVRPLGWLSQEINFPVVFNRDQYVSVLPYMDTNGSPTQWPSFAPTVENRNRVLGPSGWVSSRFSVIGNVVENAADPILPQGLDATLWGPETFIAYRDRAVLPQGWDSFFTTQWAQIYNRAALVRPQGWGNDSRPGTPSDVRNLNRTVRHVFPYAGETFGTAFIAYAVRSVAPRVFNAAPAGIPEVRFNPYPIAPPGIPTPQFGGATVFERFNQFFPRSTNVFPNPRVGEPFVQNRNRVIRVSPSDQALYGRPQVFNYVRYIAPTGADMSTWGAHFIGRRTRTVVPSSASVPPFPVLHRIRNLLPDPPAQQRITAVSFGGGVVSQLLQFSVRAIFPAGIDDSGYGRPVVTRNQIEPRSITTPENFGEPSFSAAQYLFPASVPNTPGADPASSSDLTWGKPRLTPHTIYAPVSDQATVQAKGNHPTGAIPNPIGPSVFGGPTVTNRNRTIAVLSNDTSSRVGTPLVDLRIRRVFPITIRSLRMGFPVILGVPQFVNLSEFRDGIPPLNAFGGHAVAPPFAPTTPTIAAIGQDLSRYGESRVELLNREVSPQGIPHRGNPQQGLTNPWGEPLVGFPREYVISAGEMTLWGLTWVSHKNREFQMEGWDSLSLTSVDFGSFSQRMRVTRRNPPGSLAGIQSAAAFGSHAVGHLN